MIFLPFLAAALFSGVSADKECPYGYRFYPPTAICYHLSEQLYDFDGALGYCESTGGRLVSLILGEKAAVANLTSHLMVQPWIGSKRNTTTGIFYNIDHTVFIPGEWINGEPTLTNGDCVTFKGVGASVGLQTTQCYQQQYAFCKIVPNLCNGGVQNGTFGSVQSPQYPDQYYNKLLCYYYLYAPSGWSVNIYFPEIHTERYYDFVELYEGNSTAKADQIAALSGNLTDQSFSSKGNLLLVVFRTNYVNTDIGFSGSWNVQRIQPPIISNTTTSGELTSPNYPNDYHCATAGVHAAARVAAAYTQRARCVYAAAGGPPAGTLRVRERPAEKLKNSQPQVKPLRVRQRSAHGHAAGCWKTELFQLMFCSKPLFGMARAGLFEWSGPGRAGPKKPK